MKETKKLLYATSNSGKIFEVGKLLKFYGIEMISPKDLKIDIEVPETGKTLEENAALKVNTYLRVVGDDIVVMADDTGAGIDVLNGEPGIHVRRWKDKKTAMTDQEILNYTLERLKGVPYEKRTANMRTIIALGAKKGGIELFEGKVDGLILEEAIPEYNMEGFPFEGIFFVPSWGKKGLVLGEAHRMPSKQKEKFLSHREKAVKAAITRIRQLLKS